MRRSVLSSGAALILTVGLLAGCSTPKHTNTLVFGTNTKFAIDVSEDPTGALGITLGYKRQEAVWMPLIANETKDGTPAKCTSDTCRKYEGTAGSGGAAGKGATDTYSVLATFSGQASGGADPTQGGTVQAKGTLAQFFATGFAARLLATVGGAAIVSTRADTPEAEVVSASVQAANASKISEEDRQIERTITEITSKDGKLDDSKRSALVQKAKLADKGAEKYILAVKDVDELREYLRGNYEKAAKPLYEALP